MKTRPFIVRAAAVLFILVFSQKSGAGLFLHNFLHTKHTAKGIPDKQHDNSKELGYSCTCMDDFLVPFDGSEELVYSPPLTIHIIPETFFQNRIPFYSSFISYLRGPPACKA
jgi:hypothetical protein